jgi:hypothetical protein
MSGGGVVVQAARLVPPSATWRAAFVPLSTLGPATWSYPRR